jgi:hypothetical protein
MTVTGECSFQESSWGRRGWTELIVQDDRVLDGRAHPRSQLLELLEAVHGNVLVLLFTQRRRLGGAVAGLVVVGAVLVVGRGGSVGLDAVVASLVPPMTGTVIGGLGRVCANVLLLHDIVAATARTDAVTSLVEFLEEQGMMFLHPVQAGHSGPT